ncbi:MAG: nucleoside triphosphate pyrophosphohydrolase [Clostridia bacterium]|nr:nucleoside triphosphate pyrophosphohydrolase [Clostridia bacterium]
MSVNFDFKESYNFDDLVKIMEILRSPGGCPWDAEQNHKSIREDFLEETYEVLEAIDTENKVLLEEELGDVLLQVVFHSQISKECGDFDINNVTDGICKKLIIRHPHVFSDVTVNGTEDVLKNWDDIKRQTKSQETQSVTMAAIPATFPALMKAQKVQSKAKKAGFDWDDAQGAFDKIYEETAELKEALSKGEKEKIEDELGDLLFSAVNVARFCDCNAESALEKATQKFMKRYALVERLAEEKGIDMKTSSIETLDKLWESVKMLEG